MSRMNSLQRALVAAGLAEEPKERKHKGKVFHCNKCGEEMVNPDDVNAMYCRKCGNYFIFSKKDQRIMRIFVEGLQVELNRKYDADLIVDGKWGPKTHTAYIKYYKRTDV